MVSHTRPFSFHYVHLNIHSWKLKSDFPEATKMWGCPSHMERPRKGTLIDSTSWTQVLNHPRLGTRYTSEQSFRWFQSTDVEVSSQLRPQTSRNIDKPFPMCFSHILTPEIYGHNKTNSCFTPLSVLFWGGFYVAIGNWKCYSNFSVENGMEGERVEMERTVKSCCCN